MTLLAGFQPGRAAMNIVTAAGSDPAAVDSLSKQVAMRPGTGQRQHQYIVLNAVD